MADWLVLRMLQQPRKIADVLYRVVWEKGKAAVYTWNKKDGWQPTHTICDSELEAHAYLNGLNSLLGGHNGWSGN